MNFFEAGGKKETIYYKRNERIHCVAQSSVLDNVTILYVSTELNDSRDEENGGVIICVMLSGKEYISRDYRGTHFPYNLTSIKIGI